MVRGMGNSATARPKTRRSRAELEELMITAGVEVLSKSDVEVQISSIGYARVFEHLERAKGIKVTYGSVHERIWDSVQHYQLAVIQRAGLWDSSSDDDTDTAWLRTAVALTSQADALLTDAAVTDAQTHYEKLDSRTAETLDPSLPHKSRVTAARVSVAIRDGLNLRRTLTGEPADDALHDLAMSAITRELSTEPG
jgi:predicted nucleic acid-binding protein